MDVAALNPRPIERGMVLAHPDGYRMLQGSQTALIAAIRVRASASPRTSPG